MSSDVDEVAFRLPGVLAVGPIQLIARLLLVVASGALVWDMVGVLPFAGQLLGPEFGGLGFGLSLFMLYWAASVGFFVWAELRRVRSS